MDFSFLEDANSSSNARCWANSSSPKLESGFSSPNAWLNVENGPTGGGGRRDCCFCCWRFLWGGGLLLNVESFFVTLVLLFATVVCCLVDAEGPLMLAAEEIGVVLFFFA